jgi:hypothetical protein
VTSKACIQWPPRARQAGYTVTRADALGLGSVKDDACPAQGDAGDRTVRFFSAVSYGIPFGRLDSGRHG